MVDIADLIPYAFNEYFDPYPRKIVDPEKGKYYVFDIDGTLNPINKPDLISIIFSVLATYNKKFKRNLPEIYNLIKKAQASGRKEYVEEAKNKILECKLRKKLIIFACRYAAENFHFVKDFHLAIRELKKLGYELYLLSGSFDLAVKFLAQRFPSHLELKYQGSSLHFNEFNILENIDLMIGERKAEYVERNLNFSRAKTCVFVTDNVVLDKELIKWGLKYNFPTLLIGEKKEISLSKEPLIIEVKFLRENANELVRFTRIFETLRIISLQTYEELEKTKKICRKILGTENIDEIINSSLELYELKKKFFNVEDLYDYTIQVKYYGDKNLIPEIKKFVRKRFIESHL